MIVEDKYHTLSLIQLAFLLLQKKLMPMKKSPGPDGVLTEMLGAAGVYRLE